MYAIAFYIHSCTCGWISVCFFVVSLKVREKRGELWKVPKQRTSVVILDKILRYQFLKVSQKIVMSQINDTLFYIEI